MAGTIEPLLDDVERSYREAQERMSDPAVYNDHREVADAGRKLKELEGPYRLAQRWREARADLDDALEDSDLRELVAELQERLVSLEEELKVALVETDPADSKDVIIEIRQGVGGDEAALWAADLHRALTRYAERRGFTRRAARLEPERSRRLQGDHLRDQGRGRVLRVQVGGWDAPRPARAPRRSRRGASTRRQPPSPSCPRPRRWRSRSTRTT